MGGVFVLTGVVDSKGRPRRSWGNKLSSGQFVRPWENPLISRRRRYACGLESITMCSAPVSTAATPLFYPPKRGIKCKSNPSSVYFNNPPQKRGIQTSCLLRSFRERHEVSLWHENHHEWTVKQMYQLHALSFCHGGYLLF